MARDWVRAESAAARTDWSEASVTRGVDCVILWVVAVALIVFYSMSYGMAIDNVQ